MIFFINQTSARWAPLCQICSTRPIFASAQRCAQVHRRDRSPYHVVSRPLFFFLLLDTCYSNKSFACGELSSSGLAIPFSLVGILAFLPAIRIKNLKVSTELEPAMIYQRLAELGIIISSIEDKFHFLITKKVRGKRILS